MSTNALPRAALLERRNSHIDGPLSRLLRERPLSYLLVELIKYESLTSREKASAGDEAAAAHTTYLVLREEIDRREALYLSEQGKRDTGLSTANTQPSS